MADFAGWFSGDVCLVLLLPCVFMVWSYKDISARFICVTIYNPKVLIMGLCVLSIRVKFQSDFKFSFLLGSQYTIKIKPCLSGYNKA